MHRAPPHASLTAIAAFVVVVLLGAAASAGADPTPTCLPARLAFENGPDLAFTSPTAAFASRGAGCNPESAAYDIPAGWLSAADSCVCVDATGHVTVTEEFTLTGVPAGTPVSFDARFHVVGAMDFWFDDTSTSAWVGAGLLADGVGDSAFVDFSMPYGVHLVDRAFAVSLTRDAGVPFLIAYDLYTGGFYEGSYTYAIGRLDFAGLPPGVAIHSCRGFAQGASTAALPTSWGAVKASYR